MSAIKKITTVATALTIPLAGCGATVEDTQAPPPPPPVNAPPPSASNENDELIQSLTLEDIRRGLEPGISLSDDPWDPWNDISLTWREIFSEQSRTMPAHPYLARGLEATKFKKAPGDAAGVLGLVDPTSFCADDTMTCRGEDAGGNGGGHGHRMALNALEAYPEAGIEALNPDTYFVPLFGEVDGRYPDMANQLGVEYLANPLLFAYSAFALQPSDKAKILVVAANQRWEFNDSDGLWNGEPFGERPEDREVAKSQGPPWEAGYDWLLNSYEETVVDTEYGPWTVNSTSLGWAQWWASNQDELNTLLIKSNNNSFADEQGVTVDCFPDSGGLTPDFDALCGVTDTAMAVTGLGLETTLFVCHYDPSANVVAGNHSGPFFDNTIYANGAVHGDTKSCSQSTPIVGAAAQRVVDTNPSLSAAEVKQVLVKSARKVRAKRSLTINPDTYATESVRVLDSAAAVRCAVDLECLR